MFLSFPIPTLRVNRYKGLENLKRLKILSIQSNRITKLEGLEELKEIDQLYLSHNGIKRLEGLANNVGQKTCLLAMRSLTLHTHRSSSPHWILETTSFPRLKTCPILNFWKNFG